MPVFPLFHNHVWATLKIHAATVPFNNDVWATLMCGLQLRVGYAYNAATVPFNKQLSFGKIRIIFFGSQQGQVCAISDE